MFHWHLFCFPPIAVILDEGSPKRRAVPDGDGTNLDALAEMADLTQVGLFGQI